MSARRERLFWWVRFDRYRNDGWRWRVATLMDKLPGQCWADLVSWALRSHEDDPDTWWHDLRRRLPYRSQERSEPYGCHADARRAGTCYCAKVRTAEADVEMVDRGASPASVIVGSAQ